MDRHASIDKHIYQLQPLAVYYVHALHRQQLRLGIRGWENSMSTVNFANLLPNRFREANSGMRANMRGDLLGLDASVPDVNSGIVIAVLESEPLNSKRSYEAVTVPLLEQRQAANLHKQITAWFSVGNTWQFIGFGTQPDQPWSEGTFVNP